MAEKNASKSVMGNLPSTRPARIGGRRDAREGEPAKARSSTATARPKSSTATKAKPPKAAGRSKAAAKPRAEATRAKPAASKPRAVRSGSPALKAAKDKSRPRRPQPSPPPKGTELVTTAVQAAGELAQIGLTLGGQMVKRAAKRLPRR
jgi:hypothetical protein